MINFYNNNDRMVYKYVVPDPYSNIYTRNPVVIVVVVVVVSVVVVVVVAAAAVVSGLVVAVLLASYYNHRLMTNIEGNVTAQ